MANAPHVTWFLILILIVGASASARTLLEQADGKVQYIWTNGAVGHVLPQYSSPVIFTSFAIVYVQVQVCHFESGTNSFSLVSMTRAALLVSLYG
jgi:hypothetical protein